MEYVVYIAVVMLIGGLFTIFYLRSAREDAEEEVHKRKVLNPAVPMSPSVERWLVEAELRETRYVGVGGLWGFMLGAAWPGASDALRDAPAYWLASGVCGACGTVLGSLLAAHRTQPLRDGSVRVAEVRRRVLSDYVGLWGRAGLLATPALTCGALSIAVGLDAHVAGSTATKLVVVIATALVVTVAAPIVARALLTRPLGSNGPEGAYWHHTMVQENVNRLARLSLVTASLSALVAVYYTALNAASLPDALLSSSAALLLAWCAVTLSLAVARKATASAVKASSMHPGAAR